MRKRRIAVKGKPGLASRVAERWLAAPVRVVKYRPIYGETILEVSGADLSDLVHWYTESAAAPFAAGSLLYYSPGKEVN